MRDIPCAAYYLTSFKDVSGNTLKYSSAGFFCPLIFIFRVPWNHSYVYFWKQVAGSKPKLFRPKSWPFLTQINRISLTLLLWGGMGGELPYFWHTQRPVSTPFLKPGFMARASPAPKYVHPVNPPLSPLCSSCSHPALQGEGQSFF